MQAAYRCQLTLAEVAAGREFGNRVTHLVKEYGLETNHTVVDVKNLVVDSRINTLCSQQRGLGERFAALVAVGVGVVSAQEMGGDAESTPVGASPAEVAKIAPAIPADDGEKIGMTEMAMQVISDEDDLESISGNYIGVDEKLAVESLLRVIEGGGSANGIAKAKETYEFVTGEEFGDVFVCGKAES